MSYLLGLTGSIGMGKTTTAGMFSDAGIPVWDADAAVHALYRGQGKAAVGLAEKIAELVPEAVTEIKTGADTGTDTKADTGTDTGATISRDVLRKAIARDEGLLDRIEAIVHPAVAAHRSDFLDQHRQAALIVLDIPLIFEKQMQDQFDGVLVVTCDPEEQRRRVLARGTMGVAEFENILSRQVPDHKKRALADFVIETKTLDQTRKAVHDLIKRLSDA